MAIAGAAQGTLALLIRPIFDRVLTAEPPEGLTPLLAKPDSRPPVLPGQIRAAARPQRLDHGGVRAAGGLPDQGHLRLPRQLPDQLRRLLRRHATCATRSSTRCCSRAREFFEAHSTGQLMSSIMNDIDKIQVATSQMLADLLRQLFTAVGAAVRAAAATIGSWRWSA